MVFKATVSELRGDKCPIDLDIGDEIIFGDKEIKASNKICYSALNGMMPLLYAWKYGGDNKFEFIKEGKFVYNMCPDPEHTVIFKIEKTE